MHSLNLILNSLQSSFKEVSLITLFILVAMTLSAFISYELYEDASSNVCMDPYTISYYEQMRNTPSEQVLLSNTSDIFTSSIEFCGGRYVNIFARTHIKL